MICLHGLPNHGWRAYSLERGKYINFPYFVVPTLPEAFLLCWDMSRFTDLLYMLKHEIYLVVSVHCLSKVLAERIIVCTRKHDQ